jgi:hypothetical protein
METNRVPLVKYKYKDSASKSLKREENAKGQRQQPHNDQIIYYGKLGMINSELAKWAQNRELKKAEWK